jgi:hypothetical protein
MQAFRLKCRAQTASGPRAKMLLDLSKVYVTWGLAKVHAEHDSAMTPGLVQDAALRLMRARSQAGRSILMACPPITQTSI